MKDNSLLQQLEDRMNEITNRLADQVLENHIAWVLGPSPFDNKPFMNREDAKKVAQETVASVRNSGKMLEFCRHLFAEEEALDG